MTKHSLRIAAGLLTTLLVASANAANWQVIYQTDFVNDPGWTTNNGMNYRWDSASQSYYQKEVDDSNEFAYVVIPGLDATEKWSLEYDINKVSSEGASDARFGFWDSDMQGYNPCNLHVDQYWLFLLEYNSTAEGNFYGHITDAVSDNVWRHVRLDYDPKTGDAYAKVTLMDGTLIGERTINVGPLAGIDRIGMSTIGDDFGGIGESYIDNVVLRQTPEPATLSLLALGGVTILRRRK